MTVEPSHADPPQVPQDFWAVHRDMVQYPDGYIVKEWRARNGRYIGAERGRVFDLPAARALIPKSRRRRARALGDHPSIVETWT